MQDKPDILDRTGWSKAMKSDISKIIYNETDLVQSQADVLAGLIVGWVEGKRCGWTRYEDGVIPYYTTSCDMIETAYHTYCPKCGRKISFGKEKEDA